MWLTALGLASESFVYFICLFACLLVSINLQILRLANFPWRNAWLTGNESPLLPSLLLHMFRPSWFKLAASQKSRHVAARLFIYESIYLCAVLKVDQADSIQFDLCGENERNGYTSWCRITGPWVVLLHRSVLSDTSSQLLEWHHQSDYQAQTQRCWETVP